MALDIKDGNNVARTLKTTLDGSDLVPHHILDNLPSDPTTATLQGTEIAALAAILAKILTAPSTEAKQDIEISALGTQINALAAILAKIITSPATESKQDTQITALSAILAKIISAPSTEAKQDTGNASLVSILAKIIAAPATEAKQDTGNTSLASILASLLPTLSNFRSLTVNSTAQAIKASAGELWGFNVINPDVNDIYVKFYNIAAGSVNPASDVPFLTLFVPAFGSVYQEPRSRLNVNTTAISVRAVTGILDTNTTAPSSLPIIEIKYS